MASGSSGASCLAGGGDSGVAGTSDTAGSVHVGAQGVVWAVLGGATAGAAWRGWPSSGTGAPVNGFVSIRGAAAVGHSGCGTPLNGFASTRGGAASPFGLAVAANCSALSGEYRRSMARSIWSCRATTAKNSRPRAARRSSIATMSPGSAIAMTGVPRRRPMGTA